MKVKQFVHSELGREWMTRLILPVLAIVALIVLNNLYSAWTGLTTENLIRRSIATAALGSLLFGPAIVFRTRIQAAYLAAVSLLLGVLLLANAVYAGYAGGFMSVSTLAYFWQASDTTGSIAELLAPWMMVFAIPGLVFILAATYMRPLRLSWPKLGRWATAAVLVAAVLVSAAGYTYAASKESQLNGSLARVTSQPFDAKELVRAFGITNYNVLDTIKYLNRKHGLDAEEVAFVRAHRAEQVPESGSNAATGWLAGRNVVYLQLESFQQFLVGLKVNGQEVTPNLNKIAAGARQYTNFNYTIGPGTSSDGEFSTFNSLMPLANQAVVFDYPANAYQAYPGLLHKQGYTTQAYHADSASFWNRSNTFPVFGFQEYWGEDHYKPGEVIGFGLNDREFLRQTAEKIAKLKQPYYAHVITLTSHTPFKMPPSHQTLDLNDVQIQPLQKDYLQAVHYTDQAIGEFVAALEAQGGMDKTALVLMGDHEGFIFTPDDANWAKFLGYGDRFDMLSSLRARTIPFMVYAPGSQVTGVDERPASQIDIAPTLLNLLGLKKPQEALGVDLFSDQAPTVVRRTRGLGPSLESVRRGDLLYTGYNLSGKVACYRSGVEVPVDDECRRLRDFGTNRAILSDDVIKGNRLDLLKP